MDNGWTVFPTQGRWWFSLHCLFWGKHFWKLKSPRRASSGCYFRNPILNIQIFLLRLWITICYRNLIHKKTLFRLGSVAHSSHVHSFLRNWFDFRSVTIRNTLWVIHFHHTIWIYEERSWSVVWKRNPERWWMNTVDTWGQIYISIFYVENFMFTVTTCRETI